MIILLNSGSDVFEDPAASRVQVYVRIRPLVQGDVRSVEGKGAVSVEDVDLTQVGLKLIFTELLKEHTAIA